jgi:hypothetical protein
VWVCLADHPSTRKHTGAFDTARRQHTVGRDGHASSGKVGGSASSGRGILTEGARRGGAGSGPGGARAPSSGHARNRTAPEGDDGLGSGEGGKGKKRHRDEHDTP